MNIMELGAIGELVGGVAVIGSLLYVGLQVSQSNRLAQLNAVQTYMGAFNRDVLSPFHDQEFAKTARRGFNDFQSLNKEEQITIHALWLKIMFLGQTDFFLRRHGKIEKDFAAAIETANVTMLKSPGAAQWWDAIQPVYSPDYVAHLNRLLEDYSGPAMTEYMPWYGPDSTGPEA